MTSRMLAPVRFAYRDLWETKPIDRVPFPEAGFPELPGGLDLAQPWVYEADLLYAVAGGKVATIALRNGLPAPPYFLPPLEGSTYEVFLDAWRTSSAALHSNGAAWHHPGPPPRKEMGRLVPGVDVEIRDATGAALPGGEVGEIWVRGDQVSGEYLGAGTGLDPDGWFPTRDRGSVDAEGYLFIEGRADDTIIRGGENIAPAEIEDVLLGHAAVQQVAVVGVPDEEWGQRIAAAVVLRPGAALTGDELREWARARLRTSKTPDVIAFRTELPVTETGKLLRRQVLRDLAPAAPA